MKKTSTMRNLRKSFICSMYGMQQNYLKRLRCRSKLHVHINQYTIRLSKFLTNIFLQVAGNVNRKSIVKRSVFYSTYIDRFTVFRRDNEINFENNNFSSLVKLELLLVCLSTQIFDKRFSSI